MLFLRFILFLFMCICSKCVFWGWRTTAQVVLELQSQGALNLLVWVLGTELRSLWMMSSKYS